MNDLKVELLNAMGNPQSLSVAGALGCFGEQSSGYFLEQLNAMDSEARAKKEEKVLRKSFGIGHGAVGDQGCFAFSIENLPRVATLFLCAPEYLSHLQQSLRRAVASRGFYLPDVIKNSDLAEEVKKVLSNSFEFYMRMSKNGVPEEDARFILPLYTKTNIQTSGDARELCHLVSMAKNPGVPSVVKEVVNEIIRLAKEKSPYLFEDFGFNYESIAWRPAPFLFADKNDGMKKLIEQESVFSKNEEVTLVSCDTQMLEVLDDEIIDAAIRGRKEAEISLLKHVHFTFLFPISIVGFHQVTRQRTWNLAVESIYDAIQDDSSGLVTPPSIARSSFGDEFQRQHQKMMSLTREFPLNEAIGIISHGLKVYVLAHIDGWNAIHSIGKRTCQTAQWEIRAIAWKMAKIIKREFPALSKWVEPQCIVYGKCPEDKNCGYSQKGQKL
jgi:thymidylate synthase (FAD)